MKFFLVTFFTTLAACSGNGRADIITTFDFRDAIWDVQVSETTTGIIGANAGVRFNGSTLYASRTAGAAGSVLVTATLTGAISTVAFENIALEFFNTGDTDLEHDASDFANGLGDAFAISSNQGVSFSTLQASLAFDAALDANAVWSQTEATPFGQDLTFQSSVDNNAISNLQIQLQVNSPNEVINLSNFMLTGDPFVVTAAVPEPGSFALLLLGTIGFAIKSRRRSPSGRPNRDASVLSPQSLYGAELPIVWRWRSRKF